MTHRRSPRRSRRLHGIVELSAASLLVLAGCTAAPVLTPIASPAQPSPSASERSGELLAEPVPFIDLPCADVITEEELYAAFGVTVSPAPPSAAGWFGEAGPTSFALESLGGFHCSWDNGQPSQRLTDEGLQGNPTFVGVTLKVMTNATTEWQLYEEYYSQADDRGFECHSIDDSSVNRFYCTADELQGSSWVDLSLTGIVSAADTELESVSLTGRSMWDAALARIAAAPAASAMYVVPADTMPLDFACDQFVTSEQAQLVLGTIAPPFLDGSDGGWSLEYSAMRLAKSFPCHWVNPDPIQPEYATYDGVGIVNSYLAGGEWALDRLRAETPTDYEELELEALDSADVAYLECVRSEECILHLVIGRNWITFAAVEAEAPGLVTVDRRVLIRLGELTAARLRG